VQTRARRGRPASAWRRALRSGQDADEPSSVDFATTQSSEGSAAREGAAAQGAYTRAVYGAGILAWSIGDYGRVRVLAKELLASFRVSGSRSDEHAAHGNRPHDVSPHSIGHRCPIVGGSGGKIGHELRPFEINDERNEESPCQHTA